MEVKKVKEAIDMLDSYLDAFYEFPDWHVLGTDTCNAIETLIGFAKEKIK